jgi:hypothetical protein
VLVISTLRILGAGRWLKLGVAAGLHAEAAVDDAAAVVAREVLGLNAVLPACTGGTGRCCDNLMDDGADEGRDLFAGPGLLGPELFGGWGENAFFRRVASGGSTCT